LQVDGSDFRHPDAGQHQRIVGDDTAPYVLLELIPSGPGATVKTKGPLQCGDARLDTGPEVTQYLVEPGTLDHIKNRKSSLLGKNGILDLMSFSKGKVPPRGKAAIGGNLPGHSPKLLLLPFEERLIKIPIGRVATFDQTIQDKSGDAAGQKNLVAVLGVPATLDDDIGMLLKEGNDLPRYGILLALEDALVSLVDDFPEDADGLFEVMSQTKGSKRVADIRSFKKAEFRDRRAWDHDPKAKPMEAR